MRLKLGLKIPTLLISTRCAAIALAASLLAACVTDDDSGSRSISYTSDRGVGDQPFPNNYRGDLLAFMKTYLNNPVGVHDAMMAEPVQRTVGGRQRYVSCLRFSAPDTDGNYRGARERAIVYVDARLDHIVDKPGDLCAGAAYAAFPELEKLTR